MIEKHKTPSKKIAIDIQSRHAFLCFRRGNFTQFLPKCGKAKGKKIFIHFMLSLSHKWDRPYIQTFTIQYFGLIL